MKKYILQFTGAYILLTAIIGGFLIYFDIDSNALGFVSLFLSAAVAVHFFVDDHNRPLSKPEIWKLTRASFISVMIITTLTVVGFYLWLNIFDGITLDDIKVAFPISLSVLLGILLFVSLLVFFLIRVAYGSCNKIFTKKLTETESI